MKPLQHVVHRHLFFFNDTATTEIYTLSLHDALPISHPARACWTSAPAPDGWWRRSPPPATTHAASSPRRAAPRWPDRKSTRLNSSHQIISYAVFCLKKKTRPHRNLRAERMISYASSR